LLRKKTFGATQAAARGRKTLRLDDYLPYRLSVAASAVSRLIAHAYEDRFKLRVPEWRLLAVLADEGRLTPQVLCVHTGMDKVTVMRAAQGVLKRKLIRRLPNHSDGRSHRLELTPAGKALYAKVVPLALEYEVTVLQGLTRAEVRRLEYWLRRLQRIAEALTQDD
jgi:DNA-binding MarR family transcriptional regulator